MTKKTVGIILLVISGLNVFGWFIKLPKGESIGSPAYIVLIIMMFFGGISLINSKKKTSDNTDIQKKDEK